MKKSLFLQTVATGRLLFLDGAMGTMLQARGMPPGMGPEKFCLAHPEILKSIHLAYLAAGSNILTTCTFGANRYKMPADLDVFSFNKRMTEVAVAAARESGRSDPVFIAGNVGPTGLFAKPLGQLEPREMIAAFAEQIRGLAAGGADLIFMETQFDLAEVRAAAVAAREVCDLPLMASMTFENGASLTGSSPEIFAETMQNLGCDVIGTNCSLGPDQMLPVVQELLACCAGPVMAEPNAGMPELRDGRTVFPLPPGQYAEKTARFAKLGVQILGGCCGTTPEHIASLAQACAAIEPKPRPGREQPGIVLTSRSSLTRIGPGEPLALIGERINPTGKPKLAAGLQSGQLGEALRLADEQIAAGADVLDVNVGAPHVDETALLPELVSLLVSRQPAPLALDSPDSSAIAAALPFYAGSCLVNSINGEPGRMAALAPLCRRYGAPFILLPLTGADLPAKASERIAIIEKLVAEAQDFGLTRRMILVDVLALAAASIPDAGRECLQVLRFCADQGLATTIGLSNVSFGLPGRGLLNATFLALAVGAGLCSCIANPSAGPVADARAAIAALLGHDRDCAAYIAGYADWQPGASAQKAQPQPAPASLYDLVVHGDRENILPELERELAQGKEPMSLVNDVLIPAITQVGELYERREYFLPQLIRSAETMQKAFARLAPLLEKAGSSLKQPVVVMATVEGDIHDIGKNIVSLLLGNHGFKVIDAGKDVPAAKIVACAKEHGASLIGLSALMTTTMVRMADTIKLIREENLPIDVLVGGAAVTREFADSIGASAYCDDAVATVAAARALLAARENKLNEN